MISADVARKGWRTLEPFHGMVYFSEPAAEEFASLGLRGRDAYFASRAAPMGAVPAEVVIATFYNFHPDPVRHAIPQAWTAADPEQIVTARFRAVDRALRDVLDPGVFDSTEMSEAADLAERAARNASAAGRPLFAGHAAVDWPDEAHLRLWHAATLLREFRGDGHIAALVAEDLDGCEALVTHGLSEQMVMPTGVLQHSREWPDDEWAAAIGRLEDRGLVADGRLTDTGAEQRDRIEAVTDRLAIEPWEALGDDPAARLRHLVRPWSKTIAGSGMFGFKS